MVLINIPMIHYIFCSDILICVVTMVILLAAGIGIYLNLKFVIQFPHSPLRGYVMYKTAVKMFVFILYGLLALDKFVINVPIMQDGYLPHGLMRTVVMTLVVTMTVDSWIRPYDKK